MRSPAISLDPLRLFVTFCLVMNPLRPLPGFQRSPAGLEWAIWKRLPLILLAGTVLPMIAVACAQVFIDTASSPARAKDLEQFFYSMLGLVSLHWALVMTLAIGCAIVILMKGPAYVADAYPLEKPTEQVPPTISGH